MQHILQHKRNPSASAKTYMPEGEMRPLRGGRDVGRRERSGSQNSRPSASSFVPHARDYGGQERRPYGGEIAPPRLTGCLRGRRKPRVHLTGLSLNSFTIYDLRHIFVTQQSSLTGLDAI